MELAAPDLDSPVLRRQSPPQLVTNETTTTGANFQQAVNDGLWWRLIGIFVRLTPDANAANREVTIEYRDQNGNVYARNGAAVTVPASDTTEFYFSAFRTTDEWEVNSTVLVQLDPIIIPPGHSFNIVVVNVQAGDTLTRLRYLVEKFYSPSADDYPAFA